MADVKIKFNSNLTYQLDAISSVSNIFDGQEKIEEDTFTMHSPEYTNQQKNLIFNDQGRMNSLTLEKEEILKNVHRIQSKNNLELSSSLDDLDFTIEMETGTGKTYVFLRTIMELYTKYGLSKHIIVVPSVAIREGIFDSLIQTRDHLRGLYNNINYNFFIYDSSDLTSVREFSRRNQLEIMIINIDSFSKSFENTENKKNKANIINRYNADLGYKPIELIQNTNPMIFVDEPQSSMSTDKRKNAIKNLNPLSIFRYSATHREEVNLIYKLDALAAYEQKLVKKIEVGSVVADATHNTVYIKLLGTNNRKTLPSAKVEIDILKNKSVSRKEKVIYQGDDLAELTNREEYEGYIVDEIYSNPSKEEDYVLFQNGIALKLNESIGGIDEIVISEKMIERTIQAHFEKEIKLNKKGIKVLSLFFIDSVSKYRIYDKEGNKHDGEYATIFEKVYSRLLKNTPRYKELFEKYPNATEAHDGYFSIDKTTKREKDTRGNTKADEDTYNLIMRDKKTLLSFDSKLRFIFSHSTLKEGWDNPNVFQICTLRSIGSSKITPRQQIGRGLRLCVNMEGNRTDEYELNRLSIIASESYQDFVKNLQKEMEDETGISFTERKIPIQNMDEKITIKLRKEIIDSKNFINLWNSVKYKTSFKVDFDSNSLIEKCVDELSSNLVVAMPRLRFTNTVIKKISSKGIIGEEKAGSGRQDPVKETIDFLPAITNKIEQQTQLTKKTIVNILMDKKFKDKLKNVKKNPQDFIDKCSKIINNEKNLYLVKGTKYKKDNSDQFSLEIFKEELEGYKDDSIETKKSLYTHISKIGLSGVEYDLVKEFENDEDVDCYAKLPHDFKIDMPGGSTYNPDWIISINKTFFVIESKGDLLRSELRPSEKAKIDLGKKHFDAIGTQFISATNLDDIKNQILNI